MIISRQQRRVQLMRIKQREDRKEKKKKRRPHHPPPHQHKAHPPEPAYRRKPNPVRRFDGDVLSPVSPTPRVEISPGLGHPFLLHAGGLGRRGRGAWVPGGGWQSSGWAGAARDGAGQEQSPLTFSSAPSPTQSYIQSFRERQTGPSLTSLMASSHAVVDLDYDCSSTVPLTTGSGPAVRV